MAKRTEIQQQIYKNELRNYSEHLFDCPLDCESIPNELVRALYLFKNSDGKLNALAIKMTQANSPQDLGNFGLWFGEVSKTPVKDRISNVLDSVLKYSSKSIVLPL